MAQLVLEATVLKKESDIEMIVRLLNEWLPKDQIVCLSCSWSMTAMESKLKFKRRVLKSDIMKHSNANNVDKYLNETLPKTLARYINKWNMFDEVDHLVVHYDVFIPNLSIIAAMMQRELYERYSKEFDSEVHESLKS